MNKTEWQKLTDLLLQGLNILWLQNWQLQTIATIRCHAVGFLPFQQTHLWSFGTQRTLQQLCCSLENHPVQYQSNSTLQGQCHESSRGITSAYYLLKGLCIRPRGITLIESTRITWFSRWSGRGGWSSRAVAQWRPRVSKLRLKGPSYYHSNEIAVEAAWWGARGPS
jgi:hypothetical protein